MRGLAVQEQGHGLAGTLGPELWRNVSETGGPAGQVRHLRAYGKR